MPNLFKPDVAKKLPADAEIVDRNGTPHFRTRERGQTVYYPLTTDGKKYLQPGNLWAVEVRQANGRRKRVRFSTVRSVSEKLLAKLLEEIEAEKHGIKTVSKHQTRLLADLLNDYRQHQADKGNTPEQVLQASRRCEMVFNACGFITLADLDSEAVERWLADRRSQAKSEGGIGPRTSNNFMVGLKAFGNWLVRTDKLTVNPFRHLPRVNVQTDIRHTRRPLTDEEFRLLLTAAEAGPSYRGLSGPARRMLYFVAAYTGLRASELASLNADSFNLTATPATLTVEAAYSKHKRRDVLPVHPELVRQLAPWLEGRECPLWPGKWAKHSEAVELVRFDLKAARAAWIQEASNPEEAQQREASDFLEYKNHKGEVADFHAFRHRFVTELVRSGVAPKDAKELARHSTITLTMDCYSHVTIQDTATALNRLSVIPGDAQTEAQRAAGRAATFDEPCENLTTLEESGDDENALTTMPEADDLQGFEESLPDLTRLEESTPKRIRTFNLRFRSPLNSV